MAEIKVIINGDATQAFVQIDLDPITDGDTELSVEDLLRVLRAKKVTYGINESSLTECVKKENWGQKRLAAEGRAALNGVDAQITRLFNLTPKTESGAPTIDEHGNADYKDLGLFHNVRAGDVLAQRTPSVDGQAGMNVYGQEIGYTKGREFVLPKGKNTYTNDDDTQLFAAIDGQVRLISNLIAVEPTYEVSGSVDYSTGNIDFVGNVIIRGNVTSGFDVRAQGNIDIGGYVESAQVIAGGNIKVKGGIKTGLKGLVHAGGSVFSKFIENSRIEAGEDVVASEAIIQSTVVAGQNVRVTENKATIVGGLIQAGGEVEAKAIGSPLATNTVFEVGINPTLRARYYTLLKDLEKVKEDITAVDGNIKVIQNSGVKLDQLSPQRKQMLLDFLGTYKELLQTQENIEQEVNSLKGMFTVDIDSKVRALKVIYPGVSINIGPAVYTVNDEMLEVEFVYRQGEIKMNGL
jgi:uncharacterized protein (DUF342 family)